MTQLTSEQRTDSADHTRGQADPAARRVRMREFQSRLVDRLQAARDGTEVSAGRLGIVIGQSNYLLDLQQAGEIVAVGTITSVPLTQRWFLGLANIRGSLIGVVDYAHFQGAVPTVIDRQSRIIAFGPNLAFSSALLVSRVVGLRNLADMQPQTMISAPPLNAVITAGIQTVKDADHFESYLDQDQVVWRLLDLLTILQDPRFLQVGI